MQVRISPTLTANPILTLEDLGLERSVGLDQASRGLAERSEAQIVRWVQFPAGALFFTLVPEDPESGAVYVFDRRNGVFYLNCFYITFCAVFVINLQKRKKCGNYQNYNFKERNIYSNISYF